MKNEYLPADKQDIDNILDEESSTLVEDFESWEDECGVIREKEEAAIRAAEESEGGNQMIEEIPIKGENRLFKVPSKSEPGTTHDVRMLKTINSSFIFKCDCPGYTFREYKEPLYECRHIREVQEALKDKKVVSSNDNKR